MARILLAAVGSLALVGCDASDPLGLYPESAITEQAPLELTGRVVDAADLLTSAQEERLTEQLARLEQQTLAQLVVVTTPSLEGRNIEDYSLALGRGWGIGHAERDDGLLIVVAPNEGAVRIEVGYGLEKRVDDVFAKGVIDEMTPHFREGRYDDGISVGVSQLSNHLREPKLKEAA